MYSFIINPYNNKKVFTNSSLGKEIIKNYVINMKGGAGIIDNALSLFGLNNIDMIPDNFGDMSDLHNPDNWSARERRARHLNPIRNSPTQTLKARKNWAKLWTSNIQKKIVEQLQILNTDNFNIDLVTKNDYKHESGIIDFKLKDKNNWINDVWNNEWNRSKTIKDETYYNYSNLEANKKKINFFNGNSLMPADIISTYTNNCNNRKFSRFFLYDIFYLEQFDSQIVNYLIELVRLRTINSVCPQNIKLDINLNNDLQFKSFDFHIKESNIDINYDERYHTSDFCNYLDLSRKLEQDKKFLTIDNYNKLFGMNSNNLEGPGKCLRNILNNCGKKYNKLFINVLIVNGDISAHANFLLFERNRIYQNKKYKIEKDKNNNIIWNVSRYDPNGNSYRELDEIFKNNIFKNITWINYKGLIYDNIYKHFYKLYPEIISTDYSTRFNKIRNIGITEEKRYNFYFKRSAVYNPSGTCNILSLYLVILSIWNTLIPINRLLEYIIKKMGDHKRLFRLSEELLIRYLYELLFTQSNLFNSPDSVDIELPMKNIYYKSKNRKGDFTIINNLIEEIANSPILVDNDGRKIESVFVQKRYTAQNQYFILENITYVKELLKLKVIAEYEENSDIEKGYNNQKDLYYKVVNIELLKNTSVIINNKSATIVSRMSGGYYKIKFNDTKKTKKVKFSDIKIDVNIIEWDNILLTLKLIDIVKSYMRFTFVTFTPSDAIESTEVIDSNIKDDLIEGIVVKNYYNGILKILTQDRYYDVHIDNIADKDGWYIYTIDDKGYVHITIDSDELLEDWNINRWQKSSYADINLFRDRQDGVFNVNYYYKID